MKTAEKLEALRKVRELLAVPERWTQGAMCRDDRGNDLDYRPWQAEHELEGARPVPVCFCLVGATAQVMGGVRESMALDAVLLRVLEFDGLLEDESRFGHDGEDLYEWNDEHTHAEVLDLLDRTIALFESEAA